MAEIVYLLCALTSIACAVLLLRGYQRGGAKLLLWSGLCFSFLALNNVLLVLDKMVVQHTDLSLARGVTALVGVGLLLYGLIWRER